MLESLMLCWYNLRELSGPFLMHQALTFYFHIKYMIACIYTLLTPSIDVFLWGSTHKASKSMC